MNGSEFWRRWRYDIIRGALIFSVVVGIGLTVQSMVGRGRTRLNDLRRTFDVNFNAPDRQDTAPWSYTAVLPAKATLWLRDVNGSITVEPAAGESVEVRAERSFRHSSPDSVQLLTNVSHKGLTVCAVWPSRAAQCGPDGRYSTGGMEHGNDVAVQFTVRLPKGVELDLSTVNGDVDVRGASAPVGAVTVNGDVSIETAAGPVRATTVNGDVDAVIRGFAGPGEVKVTTVRGDATLELPADLNAVVDGHTVAGDISTDFPVTVTGKFASHSIAGTIGTGGRQVHVATVTGDVLLRKVQAVATTSTTVTTAVEVSPPAAPRPPQRTRPPRSQRP